MAIFSWTNLRKVLTGQYASTTRVKVDQEQRSFAECSQFGFLDEFVDSSDAKIPDSSLIVYRISLATPANLIKRDLQVISGGRRYRVYANNAGATITTGAGGWVDLSAQITPRNQNKPEELDAIPDSGITIERTVGGTYVPAAGAKPIATETQFTDAGGQLRRGSSSPYSGSSDKLGLSATTFYVVLRDYGNTGEDTDGHIGYAFEVIYSDD